MTKLKPLSVPQLLILRTAADRADHMVLPLPAGIQARGAAQARILSSLLQAALVEEVLVRDQALSWRQDGEGALYGLRLTPAGKVALGYDEAASSMPASTSAAVNTKAEPPSRVAVPAPQGATEPGGKLGKVLQALRVESGATLVELAGTTGWLPHTIRAAMTGLRKRGFPVRLREAQGRKAYRLDQAG